MQEIEGNKTQLESIQRLWGTILLWRLWPDLVHLHSVWLNTISTAVSYTGCMWTLSDFRWTCSVLGLPAAHRSSWKTNCLAYLTLCQHEAPSRLHAVKLKTLSATGVSGTRGKNILMLINITCLCLYWIRRRAAQQAGYWDKVPAGNISTTGRRPVTACIKYQLRLQLRLVDLLTLVNRWQN